MLQLPGGIGKVLDGHFEGGFHVFGLDKDGVAYAMDDNNKALIPPDVINRVEESKKKIVDGEIKVTDAMAK
jgi:basic membrane protein A